MSEVLTVDQLADLLTLPSGRQGGDWKVVVQRETRAAVIGGHPTIGITGASYGFDWDAGKLFLETEMPIQAAGEEFEKERRHLRELHEALGFLWLTMRDKRLDGPSKLRAVQRILKQAGFTDVGEVDP